MSLFSFAGNEANITRSVEVVNTTPVLTSITLESNATTVNVGDTVQLTLKGTYSDGSSSAVNENITYTISPTDSAEVNGSVQASIDRVNSNTITLNITWIVNGHVLPPEPDPVENDATLLGVDSNNDGVRDDIERKVYATYPKAIQRAVMLQAFRAEQKMLADPDMVDNAKVWTRDVNKFMYCAMYLQIYKNQDEMKRKDAELTSEWQFNNKERVKIYMDYNKALSGGIYSIPNPLLQDCEFNVEEVLEMDK